MKTINQQTKSKKVEVIDKLIIISDSISQTRQCYSVKHLPQFFRVAAINVSIMANGKFMLTADIFHRKVQLTVMWFTDKVDYRIIQDQLVSVRWNGRLIEIDGRLVISRLVPITNPSIAVNLFQTVHDEYCVDEDSLERGVKLFNQFSNTTKLTFNRLFWKKNNLKALTLSPLFPYAVINCERIRKERYEPYINIDETTVLLLIQASSVIAKNKLLG